MGPRSRHNHGERRRCPPHQHGEPAQPRGLYDPGQHLFCGTVRENLLVAHANATDAELLDACRSASLTTLIDRLPQGLDTPVAELGDSLSGGERQRIGLARIFLNDAPFILLDEPTSALDALNEASVMQAIDELKRRGKTIVLVSHRASTCAFADFSLSVEHGRLS